jgi:drug/metabolite transporter (DMT)-like permease
MNIKYLFLTITTIFLISAGQILFKLAATSFDLNARSLLINAFYNKYLIIAVLLYGLTTILWLYVLKNVPLKIAYPFGGLAYIFVPFLSYYFLKENISTANVIGCLIIVVGVCVSQL